MLTFNALACALAVAVTVTLTIILTAVLLAVLLAVSNYRPPDDRSHGDGMTEL